MLTFGEYAVFSGLLLLALWACFSWIAEICDEYFPRVRNWWYELWGCHVPPIVWALVVSMLFQIVMLYVFIFTAPLPAVK